MFIVNMMKIFVTPADQKKSNCKNGWEKLVLRETLHHYLSYIHAFHTYLSYIHAFHTVTEHFSTVDGLFT